MAPRRPPPSPIEILGTALAYILAALLSLTAPVAVAMTTSDLLPATPLGLLLCIVVTALASFWWCRLVMTVLWWVKTGEWDYGRTGLRRTIAVGWPR